MSASRIPPGGSARIRRVIAALTDGKSSFMVRGGEERSTKKLPQGAAYWSLGNKKLILNYMGERLRTRKNPDFSLSPIRSHLRYTTGLLRV